MVQKFKVLRDRIVNGETWFKAGDIVYDYNGYDYGLANDDSRVTGIEHTSVTNDPNGVGTPSYTISVYDLEKIA